jgi:hypothetical protein
MSESPGNSIVHFIALVIFVWSIICYAQGQHDAAIYSILVAIYLVNDSKENKG